MHDRVLRRWSAARSPFKGGIRAPPSRSAAGTTVWVADANKNIYVYDTSGDLLELNYGTLYPALLKLEQEGYIRSRWGASENNRKAKFYSLTKKGRKQLSEDTAYWQRLSSVMGRVLAMPQEGENK